MRGLVGGIRAPRRIPHEAAGAAAKEECPSLVDRRAVPSVGADDHVVKTIAVDVARAGGRRSDVGVLLRRDRTLPRHRSVHAEEARVDEDAAFVGSHVVPEGGGDEQVVLTVAVDVSGARDDGAEEGAGLVLGRIEQPVLGSNSGRPGERPPVDVRASLVDRGAVPRVCADGDVREAVAVEVARARDRVAELRVGLIRRIGRPAGRGLVAARVAGEEICAPLLRGLAVPVRRADDQIGVSVTVDVARAGHREAESGVLLVRRIERPIRIAEDRVARDAGR